MAYPNARWTSSGRSFDYSLEKKGVVEIETGAEIICVDRQGNVVGFDDDVLIEVWRNFEPGKVLPVSPDETFHLKAGIQLEMVRGTAIIVRRPQGTLGVSWAK